MDENMNGNQPQGTGNPQYTDPNQAYGGQQYYGQDANGQYYGGQQNADYNQQYYGQNAYGQDANGQYYDPNGNGQYYSQDPNGQYYAQNQGQPYYGGQQNGGINKAGFDFNKMKDAVVKNKNIIIFAAAAVVALIIICNVLGAVFGHGKQSPKALAKAYVNAIEDESGKKAYKLMDKKMIKYAKDEYDYSKDDIIDELDDSMESRFSYLQSEADYEDIGDIKNIKIKSIKRVKKYRGDDLEDYQDDLEDEYDIKIKQYARVTVKLTLVGEDGKCTIEQDIYTYKRGGKWYAIGIY